MQKQFLEAGKIVGTHGIKGELRVEVWCDSAQFLAGFKTLYMEGGKKPVTVLAARPHKSLLLLTLEGVTSATQGDMLRGKILYLNRDDVVLPQGSYFIQDLIGLPVCNADNGRVYGTLTDVLKTGANDVYQLTSEEKKEILIPVIPSVVIRVDPEGGQILIRPMKGMFDDED